MKNVGGFCYKDNEGMWTIICYNFFYYSLQLFNIKFFLCLQISLVIDHKMIHFGVCMFVDILISREKKYHNKYKHWIWSKF